MKVMVYLVSILCIPYWGLLKISAAQNSKSEGGSCTVEHQYVEMRKLAMNSEELQIALVFIGIIRVEKYLNSCT